MAQKDLPHDLWLCSVTENCSNDMWHRDDFDFGMPRHVMFCRVFLSAQARIWIKKSCNKQRAGYLYALLHNMLLHKSVNVATGFFGVANLSKYSYLWKLRGSRVCSVYL